MTYDAMCKFPRVAIGTGAFFFFFFLLLLLLELELELAGVQISSSTWVQNHCRLKSCQIFHNLIGCHILYKSKKTLAQATMIFLSLMELHKSGHFGT